MGKPLASPLAILLLLVPLSLAYHQGTILITPFEYQDFGNASLPTFNILITMDCNAGKIFGTASSESGYVSGATSNLKYIQYENPLLSTGVTDSAGKVTHTLHGNISYMNGIFVLTFEKSGFQRREAHFLIGECFVGAQSPPPQPPPEQNATPPPAPGGNSTPPLIPPLPNITELPNITAGLNNAGIPPIGQAPKNASPCPTFFILLIPSLFAISGRLNAN